MSTDCSDSFGGFFASGGNDQSGSCQKGRYRSHFAGSNVAGEESKYGVSCDEAMTLAKQISSLPNIRIEGLMTIAPYVSDPEENRPVFRKLRQLGVDMKGKT